MTCWAFLVACILIFRGWGGLDIVRGDDARMLTSALIEPGWSVFEPYAGYLQIIPRAIIQLLTFFPLRHFPAYVFVIMTGVWLFNIALFARAVAKVTSSNLVGMAVGIVVAIMPATGIEILSYVDHIQVPLLLGIVATVFSRQYFQSSLANWAIVCVAAAYSVSSPSAILIVGTILLLQFVENRSDADTRKWELRIAAICLIGFAIQLMVTFGQLDRPASFSLRSSLSGLLFGAYSLAVQPLRDDYYLGFRAIDLVWLVPCAVAFGMFVVNFLLHLIRVKTITNVSALHLIAIGSLMFFTTLSSFFHNGYLVVPTAFFFFGCALKIGILERPYRNWLYLACGGYLVISCLQSIVPKSDDDVFFGGCGFVYRVHTSWGDSIDHAIQECQSKTCRDTVTITTNRRNPIWNVTIPCSRLRKLGGLCY